MQGRVSHASKTRRKAAPSQFIFAMKKASHQ